MSRQSEVQICLVGGGRYLGPPDHCVSVHRRVVVLSVASPFSLRQRPIALLIFSTSSALVNLDTTAGLMSDGLLLNDRRLW